MNAYRRATLEGPPPPRSSWEFRDHYARGRRILACWLAIMPLLAWAALARSPLYLIPLFVVIAWTPALIGMNRESRQWAAEEAAAVPQDGAS